MFNPTNSKVKWYKRKSGTYAKQINLNVDCQFRNGEDVYVISQDEFKKYFNPAMNDENVELQEKLKSITNENFKLNDENKTLKNQLRNLENEFDVFKQDSDLIKQQIQSADETIIDDLKRKLEDAENKAENLQNDINQLHQKHADELKKLNQKIQDINENLHDVENLNTVILQDVNRKNLELKDYQNEVDTSIRKAVKETEKKAYDEIKNIGRLKLAFNKNNINLNIPVDDIIEDHTPARKQGFFEVITAPQITNGDGDVEDNQKEDN